ncbi:two-component system histidine kinase PnpS [Desulfitispora alkaliphila]|uniref:two-component system histidine kinase PnpS n=1 Tax=Desulfitispora alkaliphila TaxID=622674 RepID=UPI003D1AE8C1
MLSGILSKALEGYFLRDLQERLTAETVMAQQFLTPYLEHENYDTIHTLTLSLGEQTTTRVTVIDSQGAVLGETDKDISSMENHKDRPEFIKALNGDTGVSKRFSESINSYFLYIALPLYVDSEIKGATRLAVPLTEIEQTITKINETIFATFGIALMIFVLLSYRISAIITKPLEDLTFSAKRIALGNLNHRAHSYSGGEIGDLSNALNFMAESLQEKIKESDTQKHKLEAVIAHMTSGLIVVDKWGTITLVNEAAENLLQVKQERIIGKSSLALMRDFSIQQKLEKCIKQGNVVNDEITLTDPELYLQVFIAPIYKGKEVSEAVLVFTDITSVRQLENMRSQFVANVSHELRTPLTGIKGFVETLQSGAAENPQTRDRFLSIIATETERLNRLINDILELSRIEATKTQVTLTPVKIHSVAQEVVHQLEGEAKKRQVDIRNIISPEMLCLGDRDGLKQIFINLLSNGIKYSSPQSDVLIQALERPNDILVSIEDTGIGIPKDDLPRIFERFYRVDKARSRQRGGTGLGLSIVKHLVESYGGKIWAESCEGKGSTFHFTLPKNSRTGIKQLL